MVDQNVKIQLFGDISFNGRYNDPIYQNRVKAALRKLSSQIGRPDLRIANWEAPITRTNDFHPKKNPILAVTEGGAKLIQHFPVDAVCLSNNHIADCGREGMQSTMNFLDGLGITHFGARFDKKPELVIKNIKGIRIGLLAFLGRETNPKIEDKSNICVNYIDDQVCSIVEEAKQKVEVLIVNVHWGIEFLKYPSSSQIGIAHKMVESGADVILGHHPHRLQGSEIYKNKAIFYSLGNFIFGGLKGKEHIGWPRFSNYSGLYELNISLTGDTVKKVFVPLTIRGLEPILDAKPSKGKKRQKKLDHYIERGTEGHSLRRRLHVFWVWFVAMPIFFLKSRGGIIGALKALRWAHIDMIRIYLFGSDKKINP